MTSVKLRKSTCPETTAGSTPENIVDSKKMADVVTKGNDQWEELEHMWEEGVSLEELKEKRDQFAEKLINLRRKRKGKLDYWAICGDSTNGAVLNEREIGLLICDHYIADESAAGGYKGIPNGLKQSRLGQVWDSVHAVRRRFKLSQRFTLTEMAEVTNPGKRRSAADARVYYGQMKTLRCMANQRDHDDSIVKHKLATTAVREKPSTSAASESSRGSCSPSKRPLLGGECPSNYIRKIQDVMGNYTCLFFDQVVFQL
eukprot:Em0914g1a